jgi:hypothetical protein
MSEEVYHIIDNNETKSISLIEKLNNSPLIKMDYNYHLVLQTNADSTADIYIRDREELYNTFKIPIEYIMDNPMDSLVRKVENYIYPDNINKYSILDLVSNPTLSNMIKKKGCKLTLQVDISMEDDKYVVLDLQMWYKVFLIPHVIPIHSIILKTHDAYEFLAILNLI